MARQAIAGYKLPFESLLPLQDSEPAIRLSRSEERVCHQEIVKLVDRRAIEIVSDCEGQFISPFFVIRKASGGWRFILNLKRLNEFIVAPHFKFEDWKTVIRLLSPRDFLASVDLQEAYLLVPIHQDDRKFLRFRFQGQLFQFRALPFSLASAPYIFTKIMRPILSSLRKDGFLSVVYLDDFLLIAPSIEKCTENVRKTVGLLSSLGFLINHQKSAVTPSRICRYLGFIFNTDFSISILLEKRLRLLQSTLSILRKKSCKIRVLASYIGSLISVYPAVQYGIMHTKILERTKFLALAEVENNFEAEMPLPGSIEEDLLWWKDRLLRYFPAQFYQVGTFCPRNFFRRLSDRVGRHMRWSPHPWFLVHGR